MNDDVPILEICFICIAQCITTHTSLMYDCSNLTSLWAISFVESWTPTSQGRSSPFRDHEECTSSNNESTNWFRAFGTFWWSCKSFSCIVSQWNNENNCTTSTLWWCCNEGNPVDKVSRDFMYFSFCYPLHLYFYLFYFQSHPSIYMHF